MQSFPISYLNSNDGTALLAFGFGASIQATSSSTLDDLESFLQAHKGEYNFGMLSYDLKNKMEDLASENNDGLDFPDYYFWVPNYVIAIEEGGYQYIQGKESEESRDFLISFIEEEAKDQKPTHSFQFKPRISKEEYLRQLEKLKEHIQLGNCYEINFCQEFYAENVVIKNQLATYFKLNSLTKAPFSAFLSWDDKAVFCGSPERYLKKTGQRLISEPIKGTAKRGQTTEEDEILKATLINDPKERAENTMIVDLVRNDLSRIAVKNSVRVDELCGIYSFETVHQMISTISCEVDEKCKFTDILKATFPMGSMTGVPKIRVMQLIEEHEQFKRGLYSGSIGYIMPNGDFDFNVVIRSLLYNRSNKYLSCAVGGAITHLSVPENEYEECLTKVKRILDGINE